MKDVNKTGVIILLLFFSILVLIQESCSQKPPSIKRDRAVQKPPSPDGFRPNIDVSAYKYKWLDLAYANKSKAQKLDIYLPSNKGPFPLIIAIHGGGWEGGDKRDGMLAPILQSLNRGYGVASINYRLINEAKFPAQIYDVKAAIRFLKANAGKYKLIPKKFGIWGASAGGHLAALAGTSGDVEEVEDLSMGNKEQSNRIQAVITWFAPFTLSKMLKHPTIAKLFDPGVEETSDIVKKSMPATYISKDDPPFFLEHGNKDRLTPFFDSILFASALEKAIGKEKVKLKIIEGADHGDPLFETKENINEMLDFLDKALSDDFVKASTIASMDSSQTQISSPEAEKRGRALLNDAFKALGGREALITVKTKKVIFHQINQDDLDLTQTITIVFPDKIHIVTNAPNGEMTMAVTKDDAWVKMPQQPAMPMPELQANNIRRSLLRDPRNIANNLKDLKVQYIGQKKLSSKIVKDILITRGDYSFHLLINPGTRFPAGFVFTETGTPYGTVEMTLDLLEYKAIGGIQFGIKGMVMVGRQKINEGVETDIQINPAVDLKIFEMQ